MPQGTFDNVVWDVAIERFTQGEIRELMLRFLRSYFRNMRIFETIYLSRHNLYFFVGDDELPFGETWPAQIMRHG